MLIYGNSGDGKTSTAKTIGESTLIVSSEAGLLCLQDAEPPIDVIDITIDDNGNSIPKEKRIERLGEAYKYLLTEECQQKYKWIFIDSLTEISENMIEMLSAEFPDRKDSLVLYGENSKRMRGLIKSFRDIPHYNIIFTALPSIEKDENNRRFTGISLIGKLSSTIAGYFDEVLYLNAVEDQESKEIKRYFTTSGTSNLICKDRSGRLNKFEPANINKIITKIRG